MNLPRVFKLYLLSQKTSPVTIRNYLSDLNNFFDWFHQETGINHFVAGKSIFGLFTQETLEEYQKFLVQKNIPTTTINRRFSTLRKLGRFAQAQGWLKDNPAEKIKNVSTSLPADAMHQALQAGEVLMKFQKHLEKEKISPMTIKNYLSDIKHFLNWLEVVG